MYVLLVVYPAQPDVDDVLFFNPKKTIIEGSHECKLGCYFKFSDVEGNSML